MVSQVPPLPFIDLYPPSQIRDLDATLHGDEIHLTWTAPGDDFDIGKGKSEVFYGYKRKVFLAKVKV